MIIRTGAIYIRMVGHRGFNPCRAGVPIQDVLIGCPEEPVHSGCGRPAGYYIRKNGSVVGVVAMAGGIILRPPLGCRQVVLQNLTVGGNIQLIHVAVGGGKQVVTGAATLRGDEGYRRYRGAALQQVGRGVGPKVSHLQRVQARGRAQLPVIVVRFSPDVGRAPEIDAHALPGKEAEDGPTASARVIGRTEGRRGSKPLQRL